MMDCVVRIYRVPLSAAVRVRNVIIQYYTVVRNGENPYPVAGGKGGGIPYIGGTVAIPSSEEKSAAVTATVNNDDCPPTISSSPVHPDSREAAHKNSVIYVRFFIFFFVFRKQVQGCVLLFGIGYHKALSHRAIVE